MLQKKEIFFWKVHLTLWAMYIAYTTLPTYKLPEGDAITILFFYLLHFGSMVTVTYLYRLFYIKIDKIRKYQKVLFIVPLMGIFTTGGIFFLLNSHGFIYHYKNWENVQITTEMRLDYLLECMWDVLPWFFGFHLFKYAQTLKEREIGLLKSLHDSELDRLRKQLNPHFLFNALNGIRALVLIDPTQAREAIGQLSDLLRLSLKTNLDTNITLSEEREILENYLAIEQLRFQDRITFEIDIPNNLKKYKVLPFCLQILAENAIKHGIGKQKKGGIIKVLAEKKHNNLILQVMNTGSFKHESDFVEESTGIGLDNLIKRLKINFGEKGKFNICEENQWVTATIVLPMEG